MITWMATHGYGRRMRASVKLAQFPGVEDHLYQKFVYRRQYQGLVVHDDWLRREFKRCLAEIQPRGWEQTKASKGWCYNFCRRYDITDQAKTNKKKLPLSERLQAIQGFHGWFLYDLQWSGTERSAKYGRFPALLMFHCDQIPLPFVFGGRHSKNPRGTQCRVAQPGEGLDKRQATLHLTIRAEGRQIVKPVLVFRGYGVRIPAEEIVQYPDNIEVWWQPKAWVDSVTFRGLVKNFGESTAALREEHGEVMLAMDRLSGQVDPENQEALNKLNVYQVLTPANCTDVTAPVDHHVGANLKEKIGVMYDHWVEGWERAKEPELSAGDRRLLLANWVSVAWDSIQENEHLLRQAFVETGFLVAKDGSENHLIDMAGKEDYTVPVPEYLRE